MSNTHHFKAGEGSLWAQIHGPNTQPVFLGCHQLGDIEEPLGDVELIYCPDPSGPNRFVAVGSIQGAPGAITTTITTDITDEIDSLEMVGNCAFTLFAHVSTRGRKNNFNNYDRSFVLFNTLLTSRGISNLVARTPEDNTRSEQTYDVSAEALLRPVRQRFITQSIAATQDILDIAFCGEDQCRTSESPAQFACDYGYAVTSAPAGSPTGFGQVLRKALNSNWQPTDADPFSAGEDISAVACFDLDRFRTRVIVARGTASGDPAEVAISDDEGENWSVVEVGSVSGQYVTNRHAMFALDYSNVWLATDDGYIYHSSSGGAGWTTQEQGQITSAALNAINFVDPETGWVVGAGNVIARTVDGGTSWSIVTGPSAEAANDAISVKTLDRNRAWVGYDSGSLWFTNDGGVTWGERDFPEGELTDVVFWNDQIGYAIHNSNAGVGTVYKTITGGYFWEVIDTPDNSGLNALALCDKWTAFVAGNGHDGLGYIAQT